jgi:hypothetical protein
MVLNDEGSWTVFTLDDIIWLDRIVEKLAWKHHVLPSEVEEVLTGKCRVSAKTKVRLKENICIMPSVKQRQVGICPYFLSRSLVIRRLLSHQGIWTKMKGKSMPKNKIKKEMSIYEASDFWDEHDLGEFDDFQEVDGIKFSLKKKKYIGIDRDLYASIKSKAKNLKKAEDVLIHEWLQEKVTPAR